MTHELLLLKTALVAYLLAAGAFGLLLLVLHPISRLFALALLLTAFLAHGGGIVARSISAGHVAVITDYEALSFFAWLVVGVYLAVELRYRLPAVGAVVAVLAFVVTLGAAAFYSGVRELPPNLRST